MTRTISLTLTSLLLAAGLFATGCGNACDDAVDHLEECGANPDQSNVDECSEASECAAECINKSSCDALTGKDEEGARQNFACIVACGQ